MMRALFEALATFREKRSRAKKAIVPRSRTRPEVEALEDRWLLATLLWVAQNPGNWSVPANWANTSTGAEASPSNGDSLIFDPSHQTARGNKQGTNIASTNNFADLSLANFTIATGYTATITVENDFATTNTVTIANGKLDGASTRLLTASGSFDWSGGTISMSVELGTANVHPSFSLSGSGAKTLEDGDFTNYGSATWAGTGNLVIKDNGQFKNEYVFDVQTDADITKVGLGGAFINHDTFKKTMGGGTTTVETVFTNSDANGLVSFQSGTVAFTSVWTQSLGITELNGGNCSTTVAFALNGGQLIGVGTITGNVDSAGGEVVPGVAGAPGNLSIVGDYTMTAASKVTINVNAFGVGTLNVQGGATLNGTLRVNRDANYTPSDGTVLFFLYSSSGGSGNFSTFDIPNNDWTSGVVEHLHFTPMESTYYYTLDVNNLPGGTGGDEDED